MRDWITAVDEAFGDVGDEGVEVIRVVANVLHPYGKGIKDRVLGGYEVATMVVEILLEVGRFDMDGGMELTMIKVHINIQESDVV